MVVLETSQESSCETSLGLSPETSLVERERERGDKFVSVTICPLLHAQAAFFKQSFIHFVYIFFCWGTDILVFLLLSSVSLYFMPNYY